MQEYIVAQAECKNRRRKKKVLTPQYIKFTIVFICHPKCDPKTMLGANK